MTSWRRGFKSEDILSGKAFLKMFKRSCCRSGGSDDVGASWDEDSLPWLGLDDGFLVGLFFGLGFGGAMDFGLVGRGLYWCVGAGVRKVKVQLELIRSGPRFKRVYLVWIEVCPSIFERIGSSSSGRYFAYNDKSDLEKTKWIFDLPRNPSALFMCLLGTTR